MSDDTDSFAESFRRSRASLNAAVTAFEKKPDDITLEDVSLGACAARVYTPRDCEDGLILYMHGGGFVFCNLDTHDRLCALLARFSKRKVISLEYPLSPEVQFPAALQTGRAALMELTGGRSPLGDLTGPVCVAGDSAGGTLTARLAQLHSDLVSAQILIYPLLDLAQDGTPDDSGVLTVNRKALEWIRGQYLGEADPKHPDASPIYECNLSDVAPAYIITAGLDPIKGDGERYAQRLTQAGRFAIHCHYPKMPHGFCSMTRLFSTGEKALAEAGEWLLAQEDQTP